MTTTEHSPNQPDLLEAYTVQGMVEAGLQYSEAQSLVDNAHTGAESSAELVRGTFQGQLDYPSDRRLLDNHFSGGVWRVIDRDGQPYDGTPAQQLRSPEGIIENPRFLGGLASKGAAVETDRRDDGQGHNRVPVNNIWRLGRSPDGSLLPWARVITIDADASDAARPINATVRPRGIEISERVVVFPNLAIPEAKQA